MFGELDPLNEEERGGKAEGTPGRDAAKLFCSELAAHPFLLFQTHNDTDNRRLPPRGLSREVRDARKRRLPAGGLGAGDGEEKRARERTNART
mgnify:CR=1 FL=1|jgi:hypothetical protein